MIHGETSGRDRISLGASLLEDIRSHSTKSEEKQAYLADQYKRIKDLVCEINKVGGLI